MIFPFFNLLNEFHQRLIFSNQKWKCDIDDDCPNQIEIYDGGDGDEKWLPFSNYQQQQDDHWSINQSNKTKKHYSGNFLEIFFPRKWPESMWIESWKTEFGWPFFQAVKLMDYHRHGNHIKHQVILNLIKTKPETKTFSIHFELNF